MEFALALTVGILFACGFYLLKRRSIVKLILGLALLGHGTNLLIFVAAGLTRVHAPIIGEGAERLDPPHADPLPQAMVLTAIVISFGIIAFTSVLVHRTVREMGTDDLDRMRSTDEPG